MEAEKSQKRVLIVEDEFSIAMDIESRLIGMGYASCGIAMEYGEALGLAADLNPDIILMDINLKGEKTGIDSALSINRLLDIPIIFLTANSDPVTFERANQAKPYGFVLKPFNDLDLKNAIEIALARFGEHRTQFFHDEVGDRDQNSIENAGDTGVIFIKEKGQMIRVALSEIIRLEALDNYTILFTDQGKKIVGGFLKDVLLKLPENKFIRIHRSHAIALDKLEKIEDNLLYVDGEAIPISKSYKAAFQERINIL